MLTEFNNYDKMYKSMRQIKEYEGERKYGKS
jgi:hypothetical protein